MKVMLKRLMLAFACLATGACISTEIDELSPSLETLRMLREQRVPLMALGGFTVAKGVNGRSVSIRGSTINPAKGSDFAEFLRASFETELKAAGTLDPNSSTVLAGVLTESRAGENLSSGTGALGAEITLMRDGRIVFKKPYRVETQWKSDFIGAIAIPDAFREYNSLYTLLVRQIFGDPDFVAAAKGLSKP